MEVVVVHCWGWLLLEQHLKELADSSSDVGQTHERQSRNTGPVMEQYRPAEERNDEHPKDACIRSCRCMAAMLCIGVVDMSGHSDIHSSALHSLALPGCLIGIDSLERRRRSLEAGEAPHCCLLVMSGPDIEAWMIHRRRDESCSHWKLSVAQMSAVDREAGYNK